MFNSLGFIGGYIFQWMITPKPSVEFSKALLLAVHPDGIPYVSFRCMCTGRSHLHNVKMIVMAEIMVEEDGHFKRKTFPLPLENEERYFLTMWEVWLIKG